MPCYTHAMLCMESSVPNRFYAFEWAMENGLDDYQATHTEGAWMVAMACCTLTTPPCVMTLDDCALSL